MNTAVSTKKATSRPKTTALVAFWAGTTVLSRTAATTFSRVSTASVVQSATARSLSLPALRLRTPERTRCPPPPNESRERADLARRGEHRVDGAAAIGPRREHDDRAAAAQGAGCHRGDRSRGK